MGVIRYAHTLKKKVDNMSNRDLLKHAAEIEKETFRVLIPINTPSFKTENGDGWHLELYRAECGALCAVWCTLTGSPQYYIIDINA